MTQQEIYDLCIEYGACVQSYVDDAINYDGVGNEQHAAIMIMLENILMQAGVIIDQEYRRRWVRDIIEAGLKAKNL